MNKKGSELWVLSCEHQRRECDIRAGKCSSRCTVARGGTHNSELRTQNWRGGRSHNPQPTTGRAGGLRTHNSQLRTGRAAGRAAGFTLIELLVVVTIVGLLAGIAVVNVLNAQRKAAENVLRADLALMRQAIDNFYADKQRYPSSLEELVEGKYMRKVPVDPISKSADTWVPVTEELALDSDFGGSSGSDFDFDEPTGPGISDVKSGAEGETLDGVPYGEL